MKLRHLKVRAWLTCALLQGLIPVQALAASHEDSPGARQPVTLHFINADIEAVARTIALATGRDVMVDPRVKGTLTLDNEQAVKPAVALDQFATALRLQGYAIVEVEGMLKVVPEADAKLQAASASMSGDLGARTAPHGNRIATRVFRIQHESAASLMAVLRPLIPPNNTINLNPGSNALVITDYMDNLERIARIVALLDVPVASDVEVIALQHTVASDMLPLVTRLLDGGTGGPAGGGGAGASGGIEGGFHTALTADPRSNSLLLRAANPARAALVRTLIEKLDRRRPGAGPAGNIHVVRLKNADAVRLAVALRAAVAAGQATPQGGAGGAGGNGGAASAQAASTAQGGGFGGGGSNGASPQATAPLNNANMPSTGGMIQADPGSNSLIITAPEPQYRELLAVIAELDARRAQVMIEALIVEVNAERAASFGIQWQSLLGHHAAVGFNSGLGGAKGVPSILGLAAAAAAAGSNPARLAAQADKIPSGLNFGSYRQSRPGGPVTLTSLANLFANDTDANLLSTPNLMTLDNEEARIVVGRNVPFPTGSYSNLASGGASPFTTVERKDVGLTLRVRPQINENGTVKLTVYQEVADVEGDPASAGGNGPTTSKRSIDSTVLVEDGGIVLIGGLLSDDFVNVKDKVPLAGDIPLLGALFRSETRTRKKKNLMMFLRPVVLRDAEATEAFSTGRYGEMRGAETAVQPDPDHFMLRNVQSAPVLPAVPPGRHQSLSSSMLRENGTVLIPPPPPLRDTRQLQPGPLRGALPPTDDPASARESP